MHVVITGGLGFIGSRIAMRLLAERHEVTILDNFATCVVRKLPGAAVLNIDLRDERAATDVDVSRAECVMHLAGPSSGPASANNPCGTVADGYRITYNVLNLAVRLGVKRFINASSMGVYGNVERDQNPVREEAACRPISHYGVGKFANERLVEIFCKAHDIGFRNLRMFNVYGPGQDLSRTDQGLVSIFVAMLLKSPRVVSRGPLERFRDVVHVDDVVTAWMLCATERLPDRSFNVGSGEAITIGELIFVIAEELGIKERLEIEVDASTPGDIFGIVADISALRAAAGFSPAVMPSRGVREFTKWARESSGHSLAGAGRDTDGVRR